MSYVVVTGANGFIGNNVLDSLLRQPPTFFEKDRVIRSKFASGTTDPVQYVICDLPESLSRRNVNRFMGSARVVFVSQQQLNSYLQTRTDAALAVIHNGACSSTTETDPEIFATLNLKASQDLWNFCANRNIPFIYASSASVYGDGTLGFCDDPQKSIQFKALNLYGKSKLDFDLWTLEQKQTPSHWFGLRYFNVYGPFEAHKNAQASMVFHSYNQILKTGCVKLYESNLASLAHGAQQRDFVYVEDVVAITMQLLERSLRLRELANGQPANLAQTEGQSGEVDAVDFPKRGAFLNIGTGTARTWNDLAHGVFAALSIAPKIEYVPMPENLARHYQNFTCAELTNLRRWGVDHTFRVLEDGIDRYVKRFLMRGL